MVTVIRRLCVFCGAQPGARPEYRQAAAAFGQLLAQAGIGVVYGGASIGLMAAVADAALDAGGEVIGVIPQALVDREVAHYGLTDLRIVHSMHERKALMAELSDGFVALPGGVGTLEELFEVWTWSHLGLHRKPCALLDVQGFYRGLHGFVDHMETEGFLRPGVREMLIVERDGASLLAALKDYRAPQVEAVLRSGED
jgi:uncharacterized protein (TIGR00730 family)